MLAIIGITGTVSCLKPAQTRPLSASWNVMEGSHGNFTTSVWEKAVPRVRCAFQGQSQTVDERTKLGLRGGHSNRKAWDSGEFPIVCSEEWQAS